MRTTVTTASGVHGPCRRLYRTLRKTRVLFLLSVAATIFLTFLNAVMVHDSIIPSERDYNSLEWHVPAGDAGPVSANKTVNASISLSRPSKRIRPILLSKNDLDLAEKLKLKLPDWNKTMSRNVLFVHIGKAGGETIKSILSTGCRSRKNKKRSDACLLIVPNSRISDSVRSYFHCFKEPSKEVHNYTTSYLYNLRHPVDRTISWYRYVSPGNCRERTKSPSCVTAWEISQNPDSGWEADFFARCFPTIEDWARALATTTAATTTMTTTSSLSDSFSSTSKHTPTDCSELAWSSLAGNIDITRHTVAAHMAANFRHYTNKTTAQYPLKEILVVRTEYMWQDLENLDRLLGGAGTFGNFTGSSVTHGSEKQIDRRSISESGAKLFCCGLQDELRVFRDLMNRATNLDEESKKESSLEAVARCGAKSWEDLEKQCESLVSPPRVTTG
jgi:hypothetical protein